MLTLVLTLAMLLSVMVVGAGAATFGDQDSITNKEAVDVCTTLNIIGGYEDGTFRPAGNVNRAEMSKMICVALNGGKEPSMGSNLVNTFNDVTRDNWAAPYIEYCARESIVGGVGGGNFDPNGNITGTQAAKMLLVILGYDPAIQGYVGSNTWETNINVDAAKKGLYTDLESIDASAPLSRDSAAQMIWNALQAYEVEYVNTLTTGPNGTLISQATVRDKVVGQNSDKITLLRDKYEVYDDESAVMTGFTYDDSKNEWTYTFRNTSNDTLNVKNNQIVCSEDYTDLFLHNVKVLYSEKGVATNGNPKTVDKVYGMYADDSTVVASGILNDIDLVNDDTKIKVNDVEYKLDATAKTTGVKLVPFNTSIGSASETLSAISSSGAYSFELIDNTGDSRGDVVVIYPFTVAQIDYLSSSRITLSGIGSEDLDDINLYNGAEEDDWVIVTNASNARDGKMTIAKADVVSGEVTATKGDPAVDGSVRVNNTWYDVAANPGDTLKINDSFDLVVVNGFVFNADKTKGNISADNILYMEDTGALSSGLADGVEAKVYFANGNQSIVKITAITAPDGETADSGNVTLTQGEEYDIVKTADGNSYANIDSDEISAADATTILNNYSLYTYSEKNGEYSVEPITDDNKGGYDQVATKTSSVAFADGKIAGTDQGTVRFDNDAVIFVNDKDGVKVVSGSTVNNWKDKPTGITKYVGLVDENNGNYYTAIGLIEMSDSAKTDASAYGFVTSAISETKDGSTTYLNFEMWNGENTVEVKVENTSDARSSGLAKYSFVKFDWEDEANKLASADDFVAKDAGNDGVAILGFASDDITFSTAGTVDFADEYFVIGVDTDAGSGDASKKLATAKDCQIPDPEGGSHARDGKYVNAVFFTNSDSEVEAVFIDVTGIMHDDKNGNELCTCS